MHHSEHTAIHPVCNCLFQLAHHENVFFLLSIYCSCNYAAGVLKISNQTMIVQGAADLPLAACSTLTLCVELPATRLEYIWNQ